jgi:Peptidase family M23
VQGPVLKPFAYDEAHPYAAGQHRGIDIGADSVGTSVGAPAAGTVSFAGTVPTNGKSVTIETADGYSVTLTHLGSIAVSKGATVAEQDTVGTVGPSGTPEVDGPYVHLGIRVTADPNGYVDPLGVLPAPSESGADESGSTQSPRPRPSRLRLRRRSGRLRRRKGRGWRPTDDRTPTPARAGPGRPSTSARESRARMLGRLGRPAALCRRGTRLGHASSEIARPCGRAPSGGRSPSLRFPMLARASPSGRDVCRPARSSRSCATGPPRCSRSVQCSSRDGGVPTP